MTAAPGLVLPEGLVLEDDEWDGMLATAVMDATRTYRYLLTRIWDTSVQPMVWVMLNPSTADALADDPTIRRCIGFARRERCGGIAVVNLFALRSTDPASSATTPTPLAPTTTPSCGTPRPSARSQRAARLAPPTVRETVMARLELELIPTRPAPHEPWKEPMTPARQAQNWAVLKAALSTKAAA